MSDYLIETLLWTGALIALVLVLRRPVARHLGANAAYSLWLLPVARLAMPPLILPAWLQPIEGEPSMVMEAAPGSGFADIEPAMAMAPEPDVVFDWQSALLMVWLVGVAVFLVRRYALYFKMRHELLEGARPVGEAGPVRLVESPAANGPVAFGVLDKVVALPMDFMSGADRTARDLALAHELAHHRGRDLVANMAIQPLFALHWFNPLAHFGWQAMRRDQEAACDARVIVGAPREERAAYAEVIARFAREAAPTGRLALAAPMACPVLGDRSIVHRLRTLSLTDPTRRRRWAGRLLLGGAVLALPLTATVSYAHDEMPAPPAPPAAPPVMEAPPAPPVPPAPPSWSDDDMAVEGIDGGHSYLMHGEDGRSREVHIERVRDEDGKETVRRRVFVSRSDLTEQERAEIERRVEEGQRRAEEGRRRAEEGRWRAEEARERAEEAIERSAEARAHAQEIREEIAEREEDRREIRLAMAEARNAAPRITVGCRRGQTEVEETVTDRNGRETIFICQDAALGEARRSLAEARREVSRDRDLSTTERARALRAIDEALRGLTQS